MKLLVVGSGGREHTIAWKLKQSPRVTQVYAAPGNAGTALLGENVAISDSDVEGLLSFARSKAIDLTMVGPEAPLVAGIVDRFRQEGMPIVGPSASAARLEGSKAFAKEFMARHDIPTAAFQTFGTPAAAEDSLKEGCFQFPVVLKADGLAAGKGVFICQGLKQALEAVDTIMRQRQFGSSGDHLVIEEFLEGEEASFMAFTDGKRILSMAPSQDHKAIYDGDLGPNTGGMGAFSADWLLTDEMQHTIMDQVMVRTLEGMASEKAPFQGVLYAGLMLTAAGPKVLEFNVRFGDPETQVILPRLKSDLAELFEALSRGNLEGVQLDWTDQVSVCVVVAAQGYPGSYQTGMEISGVEMAEEDPSTTVFQAGTTLVENQIRSCGGRVLGVTSLGPSLRSAIMRSYEGVNKIHFEGMYYRRDIGAKGLEKEQRYG